MVIDRSSGEGISIHIYGELLLRDVGVDQEGMSRYDGVRVVSEKRCRGTTVEKLNHFEARLMIRSTLALIAIEMTFVNTSW